MKSLTNKLMVAAAAMAAVAGAASAQSMTAEVPFSFQVAGVVMPAGTYNVSTSHRATNIPIFRLLNTESHQPVLVMPRGSHDSGSGDNTRQYTDAKLVFSCATGTCALAQIWTGSGSGAYDLHTPKTGRNEASLIAIPLTKAAD